MYIIVEDWHFTDETVGKKNIPYTFLVDFLNEIETVVKKVRPKIIRFVFNGDFIDPIASAYWNYELKHGKYFYNKNLVRPWDADTMKVLAKTKMILGRILDTPDLVVFQKNFRDFCEKISLPVEVHYIPWNHDRLIGIFPELRTKVAETFGLIENQTIFFEDFIFDDELGLYISHGHEYDTYNFESDPQKATIGESSVISFSNRLAIEVLLKTGNQECFQKLAQIEEVRPRKASIAFAQKAAKEAKLRLGTLEGITLDILDDWYADEFLKDWQTSHGLNFRPRAFFLYKIFPFLLKILHPLRRPLGLTRILSKIYDNFSLESEMRGEGNSVQKIKSINLLNDREIKYFVFGHSHDFENATLRNGSVYLNLGTWLRQYHKVNSDFKPVRNLKYVLFFENKEKSDSDFEIKQREIH